jgi:signal transduction histidine kinase
MALMAPPDTIQNIRQSLHSLAQPLAALTGLIDLLLMEMDEKDPNYQEVQLINEQLEKVLHIVGEIHRLAREAAAVEPLMGSAPWEQTPSGELK